MKRIGKIQAFQITTPDYDNAVIVFAESADQAKSMVVREATLGGCKHQELSCLREPKADRYATDKPIVLSFDSRASTQIYYEIGWGFEDAERCDWCGKAEFDSIPESIVRERDDFDWDEVCNACYGAHRLKIERSE